MVEQLTNSYRKKEEEEFPICSMIRYIRDRTYKKKRITKENKQYFVDFDMNFTHRRYGRRSTYGQTTKKKEKKTKNIKISVATKIVCTGKEIHFLVK